VYTINCKEQFEIEFPSGGFWSFDLNENEVTFYGGGGEVEQQRNIDSVQLEGDCQVVFNREQAEALLINSDSSIIFKVQGVFPVLVDYVTLARTELVNEGYDYLELMKIDGTYVVLYEHGILAFNECLELVDRVDFEELMVHPVVEDSKITYHEINKDIVYEIRGTIHKLKGDRSN
jgi:hypothetical protein